MDTDGPAGAAPGAGDLLITSTCWACGARLNRVVRSRGPRQVSWSCDPCEVSWSEPRQAVRSMSDGAPAPFVS